jgi:Uma2 family endonuclease
MALAGTAATAGPTEREDDAMSAPHRARPARPRTRGVSPALRLSLRFDPRAPLTDRLLLLLSSANPDLRLERTAEGDLVIMSPAGSDSGRRNHKLSLRLGIWAEGNELGVAFDSSAGFRLPNGACRSPDASWMAIDRWNALAPDEKKAYAPLCPDFVVELRSPSDPLAEVHAKMREYLDQGARLGWLIDPIRQAVEVYRPGRPVEALAAPATLSGEEVLPNFVLDLKGILTD